MDYITLTSPSKVSLAGRKETCLKMGKWKRVCSIRNFPWDVLHEEPSQQHQLRDHFLFLTTSLKEDEVDYRDLMHCWG